LVEGVELRAGNQPATAIRVGVGVGQTGGDLLHVRPRLRQRDSRLEASLHDQCCGAGIAARQLVAPGARLHRRPQGQRHIEGWMHVVIDAGEAGRGDADHGGLDAADANAPVHDCRVRREVLGPRVVVEDDDGTVPAGAVLVGPEGAAEPRTHAHRVEEVAAHGHPGFALNLFVGVSGKAGDDQGVGDEPLHAARLIAQVEVFGIGQPGIAKAHARRERVDRHDVARSRHGERSQHQAVGQAEHGRVGAHADGDRDDRGGGKPWILPEHPHAVAQVLTKAVQHVGTPLTAVTAGL
jgi:hypothetical protein